MGTDEQVTNCPRCGSDNLLRHCTASEACPWNRCAECGAFGSKDPNHPNQQWVSDPAWVRMYRHKKAKGTE